MSKKNKYKTSFLLPTNNFFVGLGSVLNLSGSYFIYNYSDSNEEADSKALFSDWNNIGNDFKIAEKNFKKSNKKELSLNW